jgi:hypothetical protein
MNRDFIPLYVLIDAIIKDEADYIFSANDGRSVVESILRYGVVNGGGFASLNRDDLIVELEARNIDWRSLRKTL